ncbi:MAG TPA: S-layer family protein, partial [Microcoleaceae cyanobacterium]
YGFISSFTFGSDNAGNLTLNTNRLTLTNSGINTDTFGSGNGGAIKIQVKESTNLVNSLISSGTFNVGAGSSITIASPRLSLSKSAISSGTTGSSGNGGTIAIQASNRLELANNSNIDSDTTIGSGRGGDVNIDAGRLLIRDRSFISAGSIASGQSGTITIQANELTAQNQAWVSVNSQSTTAPAGNIVLTADSIHLDRDAAITASSGSGDGGNITVRSPNILFLRRHSQISTTAGTAQSGGNGGNITISSPFIIAVLAENSDITANAFTGKGGNINITANGIFGLRFQPQLTPNSDITASSQFGLNGTVTLNLLSLDPSQGLVALPVDVVDPSNQIQARCSAGANRSSSFTQTGRGGLPSNPDDPLQAWAVAVDWVSLQTSGDRATQLLSEQATTPVATSAPSPQIVEAQGWVTSGDGAIYLVAQVPNTIPHAPWPAPVNCLGKP